MIDKNLVFIEGTETPVTTTRAITLGQRDLAGDTTGVAPYSDFFLKVTAAGTAASLGVTLEHADTEGGTFSTVAVYPTKTGLKAGDEVVKTPVPFNVKNWVRLKFSAAAPVNAYMTSGVDKGVIENT